MTLPDGEGGLLVCLDCGSINLEEGVYGDDIPCVFCLDCLIPNLDIAEAGE